MKCEAVNLLLIFVLTFSLVFFILSVTWTIIIALKWTRNASGSKLGYAPGIRIFAKIVQMIFLF